MKRLLVAIALVVVACYDPKRVPWPAADRSAKPEDIAFLAPDGVSTAAGLRPLRLGTDDGPVEVRIWIGGMGIPSSRYRFVRRGDQVEGDRIFYWPADGLGDNTPGGHTAHDLMDYYLRGRCDRFEHRRDFGLCHATFTRSPDWSRILVGIEAEDLWTLPDESALPKDVTTLDGWGMTVELRDRDRYRAYYYGNPDARGRSETRHAASIAARLRAIDSATRRADVIKRYRGTTTGRYRSDFRPCGSNEKWGLADDLRGAAKRNRIDMPGDASDSTSRYYVELTGELSPEWYERRDLTVFQVHRVARLAPADCIVADH